MRKRYRFLFFPFLFLSMLFTVETKADIAVPVWGEIIQNGCYLNIEIEGEDITLHQRVQMKLKKLLSDDYLYTFTTKSSDGEFDETSLSIITPPSGLKDSIFDHGCKLEYLSEVALEETLEVVFEYQYQYLNQNIGEILYERSLGSYWINRGISDTIEYVDITCNQEIEVKERGYPDWRTIGKGTHIVCLGGFRLKICLPMQGRTDTLEERTSFKLIPERWEYIPNLIKEEFITIEFTERGDSAFDYRLCGTIELDVEVADPFAPFYAWFPNEHTNALVKLETLWGSRREIDVLEVEPSTLGKQKGFYILIPKLSLFSWWGARRCDEARLTLEIGGIQSEKNCDFILVTAPQELSFVEFKIRERFYFGTCFSPFEYETTYYKDGFNVKMFYGECLTTGIAHVEWGTSLYPEHDFNLYQNYPNPFNQETLIRYSLPWDCAVKLSVYNLLGERVKTLVDERQSAGDYQAMWDGKNEKGQDVASGVYVYKIDIGELTDRKKMVIIK